MVPEEALTLAALGKSLVYNAIFFNLEGTVLWVIHVGVTIAALVSLKQGGLQTKMRQFLFAVLLLLVALSTCQVAFYWAGLFYYLEYGLVKNIDLDIRQRIAIAKSLIIKVNVPLHWLRGSTGLMYLIGDLVVIIRGYYLWVGRKIWFILPGFLFFSSIVISIANCALWTKATYLKVLSNTDIISITAITAMSCSIASNAIVTAMIGYQTLTHRQDWKAAHGHEKSITVTVMLYLVEIGAVYFVLQTVNLFLTIYDFATFSPTDYALVALSQFTYTVSVTYPAIVVLIVSRNMSTKIDRSSEAGTHMSFVARSAIAQGRRSLPNENGLGTMDSQNQDTPVDNGTPHDSHPSIKKEDV